MDNKVLISKKGLKGEDHYQNFSIRMKDEIIGKLNRLAIDTNRSRNEVMGILLEYALDHCEVIEYD